MKTGRCLAASLLTWSLAAAAQVPQVQPRPADFAMQLPLTVSGNNGVVRLRLPLKVYEQARSADLADVRVFNAAGEVVPFALLPAETSSERVSWRDSEARLFPIYGPATPTLIQQTPLEVRIAANGALVSVQSRTATATSNPLTALILDLGLPRDGEMLDSLQFSQGTGDSYRAELAIDRSDDLKWWDRVAQSRVDWLTGADAAQLVNDRIVMSGQGGRYLRIQWLEGTPLPFARIAARWRSTQSVTAEPLQVMLAASPGKADADLVYAAGPSMAATQIGLDLPTPNSVVPASIGFYRQGRSRQDPAFISIVNSTFYRLNHNGSERTSSRVQIVPQASAEWVVRAQNFGAAMPTLVLRWHPSTLVFTARGVTGSDRNQFTLAVGADPQLAADWVGGRTSIGLVAPGFNAAELKDAEQAVAGQWAPPMAPQAVATKRTANRTPFLENRGLVLWVVLIAGTLLLAFMSWRLYRQMHKDAS
jgi:hypothetical protein